MLYFFAIVFSLDFFFFVSFYTCDVIKSHRDDFECQKRCLPNNWKWRKIILWNAIRGTLCWPKKQSRKNGHKNIKENQNKISTIPFRNGQIDTSKMNEAENEQKIKSKLRKLIWFLLLSLFFSFFVCSIELFDCTWTIKIGNLSFAQRQTKWRQNIFIFPSIGNEYCNNLCIKSSM